MIVGEELTKRRKEALVKLQETLDLETDPVFTQNTHYYANLGKIWLVQYSAIYRTRWAYDRSRLRGNDIGCDSSPTGMRAITPDYKAKAVAALKEAGFGEINTEDIALLLAPRDYEEELKVMANVRAFFQVAYKVMLPPLTHLVPSR